MFTHVQSDGSGHSHLHICMQQMKDLAVARSKLYLIGLHIR